MENEEKNVEKGAVQVQEIETGKRRKKRILKIILWVFGVILGLLIIALLLRDPLIKTVVEKVGSAATGTKVEVNSFSSSIFKGEVRIKGFNIANPEGYKEANAFQVGEVFVKIKPGSLFGDKIVVNEVLISGTRVNYELRLNGSSNLTDIQKNIGTFAGTDKAKPEEPKKEEKPKEEKASKPVEVQLITIKDTEILLASALTGVTVPIPLLPLTITNLDTGRSFGETLSNFANEVLTAIVKAAATAGLSSENLKAIGDSLKSTGQGALDSLTTGGKSIESTGKEALEGIKNIFNSEKKK